MTPTPDSRAEDAPAHASASQKLTVVWVYEGPVCVAVIDAPRAQARGMCHCPACHGALHADGAAWFL